MKTVILCGVSLLLVATCFAQVATIDTRGQKTTMPSLHIGEGTLAGASSHDALELILNLPDPSRLIVGKPFDYELLVANRSGKTVLLPKAAAWSEVDDVGQREKRYQDLQVSFEVFADDGNLGFLNACMMLFGNVSRPETMVALQPGQSVRILGSTSFAPQWQRPPAQVTGTRLMAFLTVASYVLHPGEGQDDRYRSEGHQIYSVESDGRLDIEFQALQ